MIIKKFFNLPFKLKAELIFCPLFLVFKMPVVWFKSLIACNILLNGRWERYGGCHPHRSFQHFFTRSQWHSINKYGLRGTSPLLGMGSFQLSNLFYVGLLGHYLYSYAGAAIVLFSSLFLSASQFIWLNTNAVENVLIYNSIFFFSPVFFAMTFARQNYSILGWMWAPLVFYSILNNQFLLAAIFLTLVSIFSFTAIFFVGLISIIILIINNNIMMMVILAPPILFWFWSILSNNDFSIYKISKVFKRTFSIIHTNKNKVKYKRKSLGWKNSTFIYMFFSNTSLAILYYIIIGQIPFLIVIGLFILFVNTIFLRLADDQTPIIILAMLAFTQLVRIDFNIILAISFWICLSPPAFVIFLKPLKTNQDLYIYPETHYPYDHTSIILLIEKFLIPVSNGERILWAFDNPKNNYNKIFSGFRTLLEPIIWVANQRSILILPNWYSIMENNYIGAPEFWGRQCEEVIKNSNNFKCEYIIYHYDKRKKMDPKFLSEFHILSKIEWDKYSKELKNYRPWKDLYESPVFVLLKRKTIDI